MRATVSNVTLPAEPHLGTEELAVLLPAEPAPVRLMNTIWADRLGVHDVLTTTGNLRAWLAEVTAGDDATTPETRRPEDADLQRFRALRDALRLLAAVLTDHRSSAGSDQAESDTVAVDRAVAEINRAVRRAPIWPRLVHRDGRFERGVADRADPVRRALSTIALQSIDLLTGPDRVRLRACLAPGCVLYFVQDHPRREWCSAACGNRARVARHYRRHHRKAGQS